MINKITGALLLFVIWGTFFAALLEISIPNIQTIAGISMILVGTFAGARLLSSKRAKLGTTR